MFAAGVLGVFEGPGGETADVHHFVFADGVIGSQQQLFEGFQIGTGFLGRVLDGGLIRPDIQVEKEGPLTDKEIVIGEGMVVQAGGLGLLHPVLIEIIGAVAVIAFLGVHVAVLHPEVGVAFGGAGGGPLEVGDFALAGKQ
ncbi:MAG: hypothetical protein BWY71_02057 [Planctomycetes bacterium ADurb.Bin412]|nr:MAG: hypothetical protein BWY71_02057 [Planctomycetes bacterium ADurb.Bin412]